MIAPGVRVARGPDWMWQNQGNYTICYSHINRIQLFNPKKH